MAGKFFGNSGFADTPCTSDKKCGCSVLILLPTQHLLIDLSPKYSFCQRFSNFIRCKGRYKIPITKGKRINNAEILKDKYLKNAEILKETNQSHSLASSHLMNNQPKISIPNVLSQHF